MSQLQTADVPRGTLEIGYVFGPDVEAVWPQVFEQVAAAEIFQGVHDKKAVLWIVHRETDIVAAAVTQASDHAGARIYHVLALGGSRFADWSERLQDAFVAHSRQRECEMMRCHARRGMAKWLKRLGWRERQVTMEYRDDGR